MSKSSSSGDILHFGATRFRVTGSGDLDLALKGLDDDPTVNLTSIAMQATTGREPLVLCNYISQRGRLVGQTTSINDSFNVSKIVIFVKTLYSGYPQ